MSDIVLTPLLGGKEVGGVCSLLEVGSFRILLDCGSTISTNNERILEMASKLQEDGGVDCVVISHADIHHMGGLPVVFGEEGLPPVPVVCSLPVAKFGAMLLYDMQLNVEMEGQPVDEESSQSISYPRFSLDDIDSSMSRVVPLKYSQTIDLNTLLYGGISTTTGGDVDDDEKLRRAEASKISLCAYNSGRTIGGSAWNIRFGSTDVVYLMDFNLKKEIVLDAAALDSLPQSPSMLIVNGDSTLHKDVKVVSTVGRKRKEKEASSSGEPTSLVGLVMETLRNNGSVLIPCETSARSLELFQILGRHWADQKLGLDHLVFLSPMAHNILEYARSQLEWMADNLSAQFFNGKTNPFELPPLKIATSIRELEKVYPGPKVVIATDGALACGLAKELLLRWGGNPLCRVLFVDYPDTGTPAAELKEQMGASSKVVNLMRPQKVELAGEELLQFRREAEEKRRLKEEALQKSLREQELAMLTAGKGEEEDSDDEGDEEKEKEEDANEDGDESDENDMDVDEGTEDAHIRLEKRIEKEKKKDKERKKSSSARQARGKIAKFAQPIFTMFESYEKTLSADEYGVSIEDLQLAEMESDAAGALVSAKSAAEQMLKNASGGGKNLALVQDDSTGADTNEMPWKIVSSKVRLQFTCDFKNIPLSGRADVRALKTVISRLDPLKLCLLRGSEDDMDSTMQQISGTQTQSQTTLEVHAPANGDAVAIRALPDRINLTIPPDLMPSSMFEIKGDDDAAGAVGGAPPPPCLVSAVAGSVEEVKNEHGLRRVRLRDRGTADAEPAGAKKDDEATVEAEETLPDEFGVKTMEPVCGEGASLNLASAREPVAVSVGEVSLSGLKQAFEAEGLSVESVTATNSDGGMGIALVLDGQVTVRMDDVVNGLFIEGAPVSAYWRARKIIYQRFAFLMC